MDFKANPDRWTTVGLQAAAAVIGCETAALRAVIEVETGGDGTDHDGRLKARFEPHVFYRVLDAFHNKKWLHTAMKSGLAYHSWGAVAYPLDSYPRIVAACVIDEESALRATSWGLPQILGENYRSAGYTSAVAMVEAFKASEDEQLLAMARFIKGERLAEDIISKNWAAFAEGYNGPAYKKNRYDMKLAAAYEHVGTIVAQAPRKSMRERVMAWMFPAKKESAHADRA